MDSRNILIASDKKYGCMDKFKCFMYSFCIYSSIKVSEIQPFFKLSVIKVSGFKVSMIKISVINVFVTTIL